MTSSIEIKLNDIIKNEGSRRNAAKAREYIISLLEKFDMIAINVENINLTPSVADEIIGVLAKKLGSNFFKQKIKIKNASASQMLLIKHVIAQRLSKS